MIKSVTWQREPFECLIEGRRDNDGTPYEFRTYHFFTAFEMLIDDMQKRNKAASTDSIDPEFKSLIAGRLKGAQDHGKNPSA